MLRTPRHALVHIHTSGGYIDRSIYVFALFYEKKSFDPTDDAQVSSFKDTSATVTVRHMKDPSHPIPRTSGAAESASNAIR